MVVEVRCQACSSAMPGTAVTSFEDDDATFYVCVDVEACEARRAGREATPGTTSFLIAAINRLTRRVEDLEAWRRTFGGKLGPDGPARPFLPGRPRRPGMSWSETDPPEVS